MASSMVSLSDQNLSCPICLDIFIDPVILQCSHSFCAACWQQFITGKAILECPVCKTQSFQNNPPRNLALKNLCEDFLKVKTEQLSTGPEDLCSLHSEKLKLYCLDDQQPVCVICLHSNSHNNHSIRPIDEAAHNCREILQELLKPRREKLELLYDVKGNFDQSAQDIEGQAQDIERQIKDTFLMLQKLLKEEEQKRIDAVKKEKNQKIQMMKSKSNALSREIAALSDTVGATEEVLRAADLSFLHNYKAAAEIAQQSLPDVPQPIPGGLIDVTKHLNNLSYNMLDSMKTKLTSTLKPKIALPQPRVNTPDLDNLNPFRSPPQSPITPAYHLPPTTTQQPTQTIAPAYQPIPTITPTYQPIPTITPAYQPTPITTPVQPVTTPFSYHYLGAGSRFPGM